MPRLFVALDLPQSDRDALASLQTGLPGARWSTPQQMHLTLHFLGECDLAPVKAALQNIHMEPFSLHLSGVGTFPPTGKARVLWAGVARSAPLVALHRAVGDALRQVGYQPETRPFHPHITLARFNQPPARALLDSYLQAHQSFETDPFPVNEYRLYQSDLQRHGAVYSVQGQFPL